MTNQKIRSCSCGLEIANRTERNNILDDKIYLITISCNDFADLTWFKFLLLFVGLVLLLDILHCLCCYKLKLSVVRIRILIVRMTTILLVDYYILLLINVNYSSPNESYSLVRHYKPFKVQEYLLTSLWLDALTVVFYGMFSFTKFMAHKIFHNGVFHD